MTKPWCIVSDQVKQSRPYKANETANILVLVFAVLIIFFFLFASIEATRSRARLAHRIRENRTISQKSTHQHLQANFLSGLLGSLLAVTLVYTNFPQTIQQIGGLVLALSQASALGGSISLRGQALKI
jgi:uncharacterized membrane protein